eukprot:239567_1
MTVILVKTETEIGTEIGTRIKRLNDDDDSSSSGFSVTTSVDFLVGTCITYLLNGTVPICVEIEEIFLPLCPQVYNSIEGIDEDDIDNIISSTTFNNSNNIESAIGAQIDGSLGILITLINMNDLGFTICLNNIILESIVSADAES